VASIAGGGGEVFALQCDVTDSASIQAALAGILDMAGAIDVLVNSAGTAHRSPAEDFPEQQLERVLTLNLKGTYLTCQAFGRQMLEHGGGSIVNIASIGGLVAYPHSSAYLASKGGVVQLTRGLALEWIGRVRVNGIAPTLFDTPLTRKGAMASTVTSDFISRRCLRDGLPDARHIVGAAIFLASGASELITGHTLPVDDGYLIA
jgi:NAD(P)-dependent dehydrogenase (short-subunit alcohol dehydrogenase family)